MTEIQVSGNYNAIQDNPSASTGGRTNGIDTDTFLKLLVTQLRYQDPLSTEGDMGDFLTQMALFTLVEQNMKVQKALEDYTEQQSGLQALGLLNRMVKVEGTDGSTEQGEVTAVRFDKGQTLLTIEGKEYPFSAVQLVEGVLSSDERGEQNED